MIMCPRATDIAAGGSSGAEVQSSASCMDGMWPRDASLAASGRNLRPRLASTGILLLELRAWVEEAQTTPEGS